MIKHYIDKCLNKKIGIDFAHGEKLLGMFNDIKINNYELLKLSYDTYRLKLNDNINIYFDDFIIHEESDFILNLIRYENNFISIVLNEDDSFIKD